MYLKKILKHLSNRKFKVKSELTLSKAYGISSKKGGLLRFDVFVKNVIVSGKYKDIIPYKTIDISLSAEYDGIHHDKFPNQIHKNLSQFKAQRKRDRRKDEISLNNQTYMIRIKAKYDYNSKQINKFQAEIIRQIQDWTGLKFDPIPKWIYDRLTNSLIADPTGTIINVSLDSNAPCKPKLSKGPLDKFLN